MLTRGVLPTRRVRALNFDMGLSRSRVITIVCRMFAGIRQVHWARLVATASVAEGSRGKGCEKGLEARRSLLEWGLNLKSEVEEGFLHSGTARTAVPPAGMTSFLWWMRWKDPTSAKLHPYMRID